MIKSFISKIDNLSKLTSDLLVSEKIALPVFLQFEFEEAKQEAKLFVIKCLNYFFSNKKNTPEKTKIIFAKLVKNDEHVEFSKMLFAFMKNSFKKSKVVDLESRSQVKYFILFISFYIF